jgi:hypothetical protein
MPGFLRTSLLRRLGWTVRKQKVEGLPADFWDGEYTALHERIFRNYLCACPTKGPVSEIGFDFQVIYDIYCKYRRVLKKEDRDEMHAFAKTYIAYMYIHLYPTHEQIGRVLWTPLLGCISASFYRRHVKPRIISLGNVIHETVWEDLYHPDNVIDGDPTVTGSIDGTPIYVWKPQSVRISSMLVNPKYGNKAVVKFQVLVTNMFRIADVWGLDIGVDHDSKMCHASGVINRRRYRRLNILERWMGDSAYKGLPG